jgi:glycosyltransferase involved in cell wall biosynthesis
LHNTASAPEDAFPTRSANPLISVIIPTRDRPEVLSRCLDSLAAQTVADQLEVIVVDDGSVAASAVATVVGRYARARLIRQVGGGPAAARNAGARAARGAFLCFTDDDCEPRVDWVQQLVDALRRGADAVAGTVLPSGGALSEASEIVARAPATARGPAGSDLPFAPSGNLACEKSVFEKTPFDESYPHPAGEDREWSARLTAAGFVLRSEPAACVVHHQELTLRGFLRQQIRYGEGAFRFRRRGTTLRPLEPAGFYIALLRSAFAHSFSVGVLVCAAQAATAVGFIRGWATQGRDGLAVKGGAATSRSRARDHRRRLERPPRK